MFSKILGIRICILIFPFFCPSKSILQEIYFIGMDVNIRKFWSWLIENIIWSFFRLFIISTNEIWLPFLYWVSVNVRNVLLCSIFSDYLDKVEWIKCLRWWLQSYSTWYFDKVKFKNSGIMIFQVVIINILLFITIINIIIYDSFIRKVIKKKFVIKIIRTYLRFSVSKFIGLMWNFVDSFILYSLRSSFCISAVDSWSIMWQCFLSSFSKWSYR